MLKCIFLFLNVGSKATNYGTAKEPIAKKELEEHLRREIKESGLIVDESMPFLGASPDGLISNDMCVEIKCPYSARELTPEEAIASETVLFFIYMSERIFKFP